MKVQEKVIRAKEAVRLIAEHDDAPIEEVEAALSELSEYAADQLAFAISRRRDKANVKEGEK